MSHFYLDKSGMFIIALQMMSLRENRLTTKTVSLYSLICMCEWTYLSTWTGITASQCRVELVNTTKSNRSSVSITWMRCFAWLSTDIMSGYFQRNKEVRRARQLETRKKVTLKKQAADPILEHFFLKTFCTLHTNSTDTRYLLQPCRNYFVPLQLRTQVGPKSITQ